MPPTSIDEWIQSRFPGSRILEQRQTARDAAGKYTREFLLETDFKYPLIEVAEHLERDSATGADVARTREAMVADHLLLKPRPDLSAAALQAAVATAGASVDATLLAESGVVRVQLAKAELGAVKAAIVQIIRTGATAAYAEPDYLFFAEAVPNDPSYDQQSGLHNAAVADADIDAERGWNLRSSAANIRVAVIDTGVRYTHQDLRTNMWHNPGETAANGIDDDHDSWVDDVFGVNFYGNTADPSDDSGHGTHVAGILGASGNDSTGITGVAWQVQIMAVKFQNQNGVGAASDAIRAINYAVAKHAHLINASWGGYSFSQTLSDSIAAARDAGILFIAAAGNNGLSTDTYPQYPSCFTLENIISVGYLSGASGSFGSNYGAQSVDLFAPGTAIYSLGNASDSAYVTNSGSSMATPFVTGTLALLNAQNPGVSYTWLRDRLLKTTAPSASLRDLCMTEGRAQLYDCLANIVRAPAVIAQPPAPTSADDGTEVALSVTATGGGNLHYQWYHGPTLLQGQTSATLTLSNFTDADAGDYHVVVSNYSSAVISESVTLTVTHSPPTRSAAPVDVVGLVGQPVDFAAKFKGSRPMQFQWEHDGVPIGGATNSTLSLDRAKSGDAGEYRVKATNAHGSAYSSAANLSFVEHYLEHWTQTMPVPTSANLTNVAYVNNGFVAVGDAGTVVTSMTGTAWELATPATTARLRGVTYDGGRYVAVGEGGAIVTSTDGKNWTATNSGTTTDFTAVAGGGGRFVAMSDATASTSTDGLTWTMHPIGNATRLYRIAYGNGVFIATAFGDSNALQVWLSTDGMNWSMQNLGLYAGGASISFVDGAFWLSDGFNIYSSADGVNWSRRQGFFGDYLTVSGGHLYALFSYSVYRGTLDGQGNSAAVYFDLNSGLTGLAAGGGHIVAVGYSGHILCSEDGLTFKDVARFTSEFITSVGFVGGQFVTSTQSGQIFTSPDGITWTKAGTVPLVSPNYVTGLLSGNGVLIVVDYEQNLYTSTDAVQWTKRTKPKTGSISFHGDSFWLSASIQPAYRSSDSVSWTAVDVAPTAFGGGRYLHLESFGTCLWSDDGLTWQKSNFPPEYVGPICYADGAFYLLTGGKLITSTNGIDWTSTTIRGWKYGDSPNYTNSFVYQDGIFFASGGLASYLSLDGVTWALQSVPPLQGFVQRAGLILAEGSGYESSLYRAADAQPLEAPTAATGVVTGLNHRQCVLHGTVNAGGAVTSMAFEYGTAVELGHVLTVAGHASRHINQTFDAILTGLQPGTQYFYRITATNSVGSATGETLSFTTLENHAPVAHDDGPLRLVDGLPATLAVLGNDADPDGDAIHIVSATQGQHGTATISGFSLVYTPVPGSFGRDEFTYTMADQFGAGDVATVTVDAYLRPPGTGTTVAAITGTDAPGAGAVGGPPPGTKIVGFGTPALSDSRQLAATVTLATGKRRRTGLLYIDENGIATLPALAGAPAADAKGELFQSFSNPVLSPTGRLAFLARAAAASPTRRVTQGIWSNASSSDGSIALVLKIGDEISGPTAPHPFTIMGISSAAFEGDTLYAVAQLGPRRSTALVRIDASGPVLVLWEGRSIQPGVIKAVTVFRPAQGSPGTGRWIGSDGLIARVTLSNRSTALLRVDPSGEIDWLFSTGQPAFNGSVPFTSFGLPSFAGRGDYTLLATLRGSATQSIVFTSLIDGEPFSLVSSNAPGAEPARFTSFGAPIRNAASIAFTATLRGRGVGPGNGAGVWWGQPSACGKLARLGEAAPDAAGAPSGATWAAFSSLALPLNSASGPIMLGKVRDRRGAIVPGLWAVDSKGVFRRILAGGQNQIGNATVNIAAISALNADAGAFGVGRNYNEMGSVAVRVTTTTRTQALLRLDIP